MDLRTQEPYWLLKNGLLGDYRSLDSDLSTDIVVMGAGITGALVAWHLCRKGFHVSVVDKRQPGMGSTAASTSLIQYEIDTSLKDLAEKVGEKTAARCYTLCVDAVTQLEEISRQLKLPVDFQRKESFQRASFKSHVGDLKREFIMRKKHNIDVQWLTSVDVKKMFGFAAPAGLLSKIGAQVDVYKFTHALLSDAISKGADVFSNTEVVMVDHRKKAIALKMKTGYTISAKHLVICAGYESQKYLPKKVETFNSTYAIVSEPQKKNELWYKNGLIWETAKPYLYLRTTSDNRIIIGGKDDAFSDPFRRSEALPGKVKALEKSFGKLFPGIAFKTDFRWAGTFASTKDGLPYIGLLKQRSATSFALGFGGNGITFSVIAARLITDHLSAKKNADFQTFSFER